MPAIFSRTAAAYLSMFAFCIAFVCGVCVPNLYAQTPARVDTSVSAAATLERLRFEHAVEYVNCRLARFSVTNSKRGALIKEFSSTCHCSLEGGTNNALIKFFNTHTLSRNLRLFRIVDSLKLSYTPNRTPTEDANMVIALIAGEKLSSFAADKPEYPEFVRELSDELRAFFPDRTATASAATNSNTATANTAEPLAPAYTAPTSGERYALYIYLLWALLGTVAGALGMRWWLFRPANAAATERRQAPERDTATTARIRGLEQQVTSLQQDLSDAQRALTKLRKRISNTTTEADEPTDDETAPVTAAEFLTSPVPRIFFLRIPAREGNWHDDRRTELFRPNESVYRFELRDATTAAFSVVQDTDTMERAANQPADYLQPACTFANNATIPAEQPDAPSIRIRTEEYGEARLDGGKWKVVRKAVIAFV